MILIFSSIWSIIDFFKQLPHIEFVTQTVAELLQTATTSTDPKQKVMSQNIAFLSDKFADQKNQEVFFCNSELFDRARYADAVSFTLLSLQERQASAKLHCLYGVPIESAGKRRAQRTYPYACSKVYDLRNYTARTMWGPFMDDGSGNVDWERMEAIMITLGHNIRHFDDSVKSVWEQPFVDAIPESYISRPLPYAEFLAKQPSLDLDSQDPYGISGTYMRVSNFHGSQVEI